MSKLLSVILAAVLAVSQFSVVSIKPDATPVESIGFACHGTDGIRGTIVGDVPVPQGRCIGSHVTIPMLVAFAYDVPTANVSGGADWAQGLPGQRGGGTSSAAETFQIQAAAENPATATTPQLREMVQAMLDGRFRLKIRRRIDERQGYALVVSKGGSKLHPKSPSDPEQSPTPGYNTQGMPAIRGKSSLQELARVLGEATGGVLIVDKTGLTGVYDYEYLPFFPQIPANPGDRNSQSAQIDAMSQRLEVQLGLRLQSEKVPVELIVIDQVEKPTAN